MPIILRLLLTWLKNSLRSRAALQAEILALRHQLLVLQRSQRGKSLRLKTVDRIFWVWLSMRSRVRIWDWQKTRRYHA